MELKLLVNFFGYHAFLGALDSTLFYPAEIVEKGIFFNLIDHCGFNVLVKAFKINI